VDWHLPRPNRNWSTGFEDDHFGWMSESKVQFLFQDEEFEDTQFYAASFVAKYRRITSLESLRDQLRLYCQSLKDEVWYL
jgi:hypothetical protein